MSERTEIKKRALLPLAVRTAFILLVLPTSLTSLTGCTSIGAISGATAGALSGVATANPAVGIGVGIAVQATVDEVVNGVMRSLHTDAQDAIASAAGKLSPGASEGWRVGHALPVENGHGKVMVTREFVSALATCKEFAFSVDDGDQEPVSRQWFIAIACKQQGHWKWASAEPTVERWGALH